MKRTVREILAECKGGREVMSLRDFTLCIKTIHAHLNLACFSPDGSRESKRHLKMADDICLARACLDLPEILLNVLKASEH